LLKAFSASGINFYIAAAPTDEAFHLPEEIALVISSKLVAFVYLNAAICSPLFALFQISCALFSYSKAALVSAASTIAFVFPFILAIELAINFC
jgi:hypothetical protein